MSRHTERACRVAASIFGIVGVLHAVRLLTRTDVVVGGWPVPMAFSWAGLFIAGGLAWWMWRASQS